MMWGNNPILGCILLGSLGIFAIGFLDDLARLAPKTKLFGEFFIRRTSGMGCQFIFYGDSVLGTWVNQHSGMAWNRIGDFLDRRNGQCR
jgi:UDP-N-acetylmuramyl pentapeptide phosphotransferase/UDP-N-acetylglucosamine-1-phosphate transferase